MATPRYRRVNIDGESYYKTQTRIAGAALLPGTFAVVNDDDEFVNTTAIAGRMFVIGAGEHQGLGILEANPAGNSAVGNYVEEGRTMAIRFPAGTYGNLDAVTVGTAGVGALAASNAVAVGYIDEPNELSITLTAPDFIMVRFRGTGLLA